MKCLHDISIVSDHFNCKCTRCLALIMTIVLYTVLSTLAVLADAKPFDGRSNLIQPVQVSTAPDVILLVKLIENNGGPSFLSLDRLVLLHQSHHTNPHAFNNNGDSAHPHSIKNGKFELATPREESDPNIVLLIKHFKSDGQTLNAAGGPRSTREMSTEQPQTKKDPGDQQRGNFLDFLMLPRRKWTRDSDTPPMLLLPPPIANQPSTTRVAKSVATSRGTGPDTEAIASDVVDYDKTKVNEDNNDKENEQEDFLASLSQIPNLWYDLGKILTQPLRHKPTGTERDSYEYFGMVGKAPYILCPLGFKKNVKGRCRPVFRR